MKLTHVVVGAVLLVAVGQCGDASTEPSRPSASSPAGLGADGATTVATLSLLLVKGRAPMTGYDRDRFGPAWLDADRNGCDTRNDILGERLRAVTLESNGCVVAAGSYDDPYTGSTIDYWQGHGSLVDIDHVVSLGNAWATGAFGWPIKKRAAFANDPLNLLPTDAGANRQKGDGDAATWLPANKSYRCEYVSRQVAVKAKYDLWVTSAELAAIQRVLAPCEGQALTPDQWGAPTEVDHNISDPSEATSDAQTGLWSGAVAGFVPVPVRARVGALGQDERTADAAREVPVGQRVEDLRHRPLRVRRLSRAHALCPKGSIRPLFTKSSRAR